MFSIKLTLPLVIFTFVCFLLGAQKMNHTNLDLRAFRSNFVNLQFDNTNSGRCRISYNRRETLTRGKEELGKKSKCRRVDLGVQPSFIVDPKGEKVRVYVPIHQIMGNLDVIRKRTYAGMKLEVKALFQNATFVGAYLEVLMPKKVKGSRYNFVYRILPTKINDSKLNLMQDNQIVFFDRNLVYPGRFYHGWILSKREVEIPKNSSDVQIISAGLEKKVKLAMLRKRKGKYRFIDVSQLSFLIPIFEKLALEEMGEVPTSSDWGVDRILANGHLFTAKSKNHSDNKVDRLKKLIEVSTRGSVRGRL
jgi:hypothetical protein